MPHVHTPQSLCRFGLARCDITPPAGMYHRMWGAATHDRAAGVHRPLTATALVFQAHDGDVTPQTEQVVVAVDHCLLYGRDMAALLERAGRETGLAAGQLLVAFSHTHGAGLMDSSRVDLPGGELIPPYLEDLAGRLGEIIRQARTVVQPAVIAYGTGHCLLAANRDFWDEQSKQVVCGFNPDGPADDTVVVARVTDSQGLTLATLVNYACHPTTLAWDNSLISPDYPGAMRELVEAATGAPCVFLQGASGDLGPRQGYVGDPAVADRNGRQLGFAALAVLEALPPPGTRYQYTGPVISGATIGCWTHVPLEPEQWQQLAGWRVRRWTVDLPYRPELPTKEHVQGERARWQAEEQAAHLVGDTAKARDCRAMVERMTRWQTRLETLPPGPTFPLSVVLWQAGGALWLAVEGEHYQILQRQLRERCEKMPLVVMTVANGSRCTYLPTAEAYGRGIYQESVAVLARGSLEQLVNAIGSQVTAWGAVPDAAHANGLAVPDANR